MKVNFKVKTQEHKNKPKAQMYKETPNKILCRNMQRKQSYRKQTGKDNQRIKKRFMSRPS